MKPAVDSTGAFLEWADERFVALTTYRKTGVAVSTPVWIATDGTTLMVTTPADSGKVKRLRNNSRVELRPSSRRGAVEPNAPTVSGKAEILEDQADVERLGRIFRKKYGFEYRMFLLVERLIAFRNRRRFILRITPTDAD